MPISFNPTTIRNGHEIAGDVKSQLDGGAKHIMLGAAKSILGSLQAMKGTTVNEQASLTQVVNKLTDAISQGDATNRANVNQGSTGRASGMR